MTKVCTKCRKQKDLDAFVPRYGRHLGVAGQCRECTNARARVLNRLPGRLEKKLALARAYNRTLKGYIVRSYRNMKSRVTGVQWHKAHIYKGLEILPRVTYYHLCFNSTEFREMFEAYKQSGWRRGLAPTPDRIDSDEGYTIDNIQFLTHSENSRKGSISQKNKTKKLNLKKAA